MSSSVLVVGGAGYIGSHMVKMLAEDGYTVSVFDDLSRGHRDAVLSGDFIQGDMLNPDALKSLFSERTFDVVMHFAAFCYVGESVDEPLKYYMNNVAGTLNLLEAMRSAGVRKFVFSSSCATYGIPKTIPIEEDHPQCPINPYGRSKLFVEKILQDSADAHGLESISLRYFNAAGCDPSGQLGERHNPETHLIPLVLAEAMRALKGGDPDATTLSVFGNDFDTPDGTCVRDYIHVTDLCAAHMSAMEYLLNGRSAGFQAFNLGNGKGYSVKEIIGACSRVTDVDIKYKISRRRPGDPASLAGSSVRASKILGWKPHFGDLDAIIETAWRWMKKATEHK